VEAPPARPDNWLAHLFRFLGVSLLAGIAWYVVAGIVWTVHVLTRTGYRARDLLLLFVPVVGTVVHAKAFWRYTARHVYWAPRPDLPPDVLRGWQRPVAVAGGWVLGPAVIAGLAAILATFDGWTAAEREQLVRSFEAQGFEPATASCIADEVIEQFPESHVEYDAAEAQAAVLDAVALCDR
jgi:hypothetical protein